jgi:hypothetical protein
MPDKIIALDDEAYRVCQAALNGAGGIPSLACALPVERTVSPPGAENTDGRNPGPLASVYLMGLLVGAGSRSSLLRRKNMLVDPIAVAKMMSCS